MRHLAVLAAVVALAAAGPRERRQAHLDVPADYLTCRGGAGVCVPYYLCQDDTVVVDGAGIIDIRTGSECGNFLDVCCSNPDYNGNPSTPRPYEPQCGRRKDQGIDVRIQGFKGNETQPGEFPWMTAVLKKEVVSGEEINLYLCGGSLIHPSIVLTAAHCVSDHVVGQNLRVRLGEWDTQNEYEAYPHQDSDVAQVVLHPGFNSRNLHNDFALLLLQQPATLSENVEAICLEHIPNLPLNSYCVVTGWGKDRFGKEGLFQNVLKQIDLPVVDKGYCQRALRTTRLGQFFQLNQSFMCAGGEAGKDACSGDGGSPLVCLDPSRNRYVQAGIVAWGIGCGTEGIPAVYADVMQGYHWITSEAEKLVSDNIYDYWV